MSSTTTLLQLMADIGDELGDLIVLTATADGSTTQFVSTSDMLYGDDGLNGREAWYVTAVNAGNTSTRRLVTATAETTGTITVTPAWPAISKATDVVYLFNSKATGVTIPEIRRKINQLIRRVRSELALAVADTPATFSLTSPTINIPTAWDYLLGLQVEQPPASSGLWTNWKGEEPYEINFWDTPKTVTIKHRFRTTLNARRVRLIGGNDLTELTLDTDTTTVPAAWLAKTAAYELLEAAYARAGDAATALTIGELLAAKAKPLEGAVGKRFRMGRRIDLRQ